MLTCLRQGIEKQTHCRFWRSLLVWKNSEFCKWQGHPTSGACQLIVVANTHMSDFLFFSTYICRNNSGICLRNMFTMNNYLPPGYGFTPVIFT